MIRLTYTHNGRTHTSVSSDKGTAFLQIVNVYKYRVQVGRGKSAYKNKYSNLTESQAALYYAGINIGNGYKKRLQESVNDGPWKTLLRARS